MKIKKVYQGELPENKILNSQSTSQTDTYSCEYINGLSTGGGVKSYIQAALNSNVTVVNGNTGTSTLIEFNKITTNGNLFEFTEHYGIKINSNGKSGRLKLHIHASFVASGTSVDSTFVQIIKESTQNSNREEIGQLNLGLFSTTGRNSGVIEAILDYNDGDVFYVYSAAYGSEVLLLGSLNRTVLILEEL